MTLCKRYLSVIASQQPLTTDGDHITLLSMLTPLLCFTVLAQQVPSLIV